MAASEGGNEETLADDVSASILHHISSSEDAFNSDSHDEEIVRVELV